MSRQIKVVSSGKDHTDMIPVFRLLLQRSRAKEGDTLIWAGCEGACYSMATFFSYYLLDLKLNICFATDGDLSMLWQLEHVNGAGMVATRKIDPVKGDIIVLMSGLVDVAFENVLTLVRDGLADSGTIIGETVVPGLFENLKWHEKIPVRFVFEFSMNNPSAFELVEKA